MSRWRVQVSKSNDWHPAAVVALGVVLAAGVLGAFVGSTEGTARMVRGAAPPGLSAPARDAYGRLPMVFEANHGQADARVRYLARGSGYGLFLAPDEAVLVLDAPPGQTEGVAPAVADAPTIAPAVLRMRLAHASPRVGVYGVDPLPGKSHYFIGNDPREWITDVEHFARVVYRDVYPGVNLVFYGDQRNLEYDLVLSPGVDPSTVEIAFGADDPGDGPAAEVDAEGELLLHVGGVTIRHSPPRLYQDIAGTRRAVAGRYVLRGTDRVGFETGLYDTAHPLVIDPYIAFATYLGGKLDDEGSSVAVDMSGAIYVVGTTVSSDFPEVDPVRQRGGDQDVFVTKLDATGTTLLASTYLGGAGSDIGRGVTVDRMGENVYLTGATRSGDFPVASAVFQPAFRGGSDAFISRLKATGGELRYSTYLGGSGGSAETNQDIGTAITLDAGGNAYVTGFTESPDFPTTSGAFDPAMGSRGDVFVAKVNPGGSSLVYATFLGGRDEGGSRDGADIGNAIAVDSAGSAYVTGETRSPLFPTTSNAIQATYGGGAFGGDAFLAQIDPAGSALSYSTFLGGGGDDVGYALDVAPGTGFAFVAGTSDSTDWEGTANAYQREPGGGSDAFVVWLSTTDRIPAFYRSFFGGSGADVARGIARDPGSVRIRIAGYTDSANLPTMSPLQSGYGGGAADGFVAEINPQVSGTPGLLFSTYLGRTGDDFIYGLDTDDAGALYLVGKTTSDTLASPGSYAHDRGGAADAFVARLGLGPTPTPTRTARSTTLAPTPSPTPTSTASPTVTPTMTPTPALTPTATSASRIVIDFEALEPDGPGRPPMVTVSGQYANLGATFNRPVALDYTKGNPLPGFTHSGTRAIELCYGQEFCTTPLEIVFAPPVQTVALWAGSRLPSAVERKVVMSAFAADGAFLSSAETVLPASTRPTPIQHPLEVGADGETIGRVSVTLTGAEAVLLNGLAVDDVAFVRASGVRPAPDTTAPRVIITEPRDGTVAVTEDGSFLLGGFVTDDTGVLDVAVTVAQPPGVGLRIATLQAYGPGPHYELGPTRTGPLFEHGPNIITVEVADFAGNVGAASVVVTAEDPPAPPPHPPVALDLFPEAIEVTQGVSYLRSIPPPPSPGASAGNVTGMAGFPFVAGKRTVVRLYGGMLEPWDSWQPDVEAVLHGIDANGWLLPGSPLHAVNGNVTVYRALDPSLHADAALRPYADRTWNFLLPTDWTGQGTIALVGEVNPYGSIEECAACFTDRNEVRLTDVTFRNTAELDLFPIWLTFPAGAPSLTADVETLYGLVPLLYPTARTNMRLLPGNRMTSSRDLTKDSGWDKLLDDVCDYYGANKSVVTALGAGHVPAFYGLVPGSVPRNGTVGIGRFGKPCAAGIAGPPDQDTAAHEIGHNLDMRHVQSDFDAGGNPLCGNIDKVNDSYPHYKDYLGRPLARASIGEVGFDTISMAARLPAAARSTAEYYDFMSYCEPAWISPYTWQYLFEVFSDRVGRTLAAPGSPRRTGPVFDLLASPRGARAVTGRGAPEDRARSDRVAPAQGPGGELVTYLLLRGEVTPDGAVSLDPPYRMEFDRAVEDAVAGSDGVVELSDNSNRVLVRRTFDLDVDADTARTGARFGVHVPWDDGATRVSVRVGQGTLLERRASRSAPEVTAVTPESAVWNADRPYRLTWQGADADGDTLRYAVQFSADNGLTWRTLALDLTATRIDVDAGSLPGTETARFRVVASDGFWSGYGETARSVSITAKAPRVQIVAPRDGSAVASGSVLVLEGLASDWEEGPLGDRALTWRSDVDGPLGVGRSVTVRNLSRGWHRVTVTATDAGGATATASVRIEVLAPRGRSVVSPARAYLPAAWRR